MRSGITALGLALVCSATASAQQGAPRETATATLKGKRVAVEYGRPSLKDRKVEALLAQLPKDRIWRAGSEQVTTLTTETALSIGDKKVPAGKYSVYVHVPADGSFSLILNSNLGVPLGQIWKQAPDQIKNEPWPYLDGYEKIGDKEVARVPMQKTTSDAAADLFTIAFEPAEAGATLKMSWGDVTWTAPVTAAE